MTDIDIPTNIPGGWLGRMGKYVAMFLENYARWRVVNFNSFFHISYGEKV